MARRIIAAPSTFDAMVRMIALAALVLVTPAAAATNRQCSDPCLQSARAERKDCATSAVGVFLDAVTACIERDRLCVDACGSERQDCRDATSLGAERVRCAAEQEAAALDCRVSFPLRPRRLAICLGRTQVAGFRCRRDAARTLRAELETCRTEFSACADACGPGSPPGGPDSCREEGRAARGDALRQCRIAHTAAASACIDRDVTCVQECQDTRRTCNEPARAALDAILAECTAIRNAAVAACQASSPDRAALEACVRAALASAFDCRQAAIEASLPSFASCTGEYAGCLRACPPAAVPGEPS